MLGLASMGLAGRRGGTIEELRDASSIAPGPTSSRLAAACTRALGAHRGEARLGGYGLDPGGYSVEVVAGADLKDHPYASNDLVGGAVLSYAESALPMPRSRERTNVEARAGVKRVLCEPFERIGKSPLHVLRETRTIPLDPRAEGESERHLTLGADGASRRRGRSARARHDDARSRARSSREECPP